VSLDGYKVYSLLRGSPEMFMAECEGTWEREIGIGTRVGY